MKRIKISNNVIRRLPKYLRKLDDLTAAGVERISSSELGRQMGLTPSQIRQDFSCFGEFGQQGYGYNIWYELLNPIVKWLEGTFFSNPVETILNLLPNLSYFLTSGYIFQALGKHSTNTGILFLQSSVLFFNMLDFFCQD